VASASQTISCQRYFLLRALGPALQVVLRSCKIDTCSLYRAGLPHASISLNLEDRHLMICCVKGATAYAAKHH